MTPELRIINRARPNPATLRKRAEERLIQAAVAAPTTDWDKARLVHELQVHQIELEMHNEELRHAYEEADFLRERYADIYDFAPVAYFTLDPLGVILDVNPVSYTHLRAHETVLDLVCRLLLETKTSKQRT